MLCQTVLGDGDDPQTWMSRNGCGYTLVFEGDTAERGAVSIAGTIPAGRADARAGGHLYEMSGEERP